MSDATLGKAGASQRNKSVAAARPKQLGQRMPPTAASASVTAGFMCAPDKRPKARISATRAAPVARVFAPRQGQLRHRAHRQAAGPRTLTRRSTSFLKVASAAKLRTSHSSCRPHRLSRWAESL